MNKKITMYELLGMAKDGKSPKKIKYEDRTYTLYLDEENNHYYQDDKCKYFMLSISCFEELNDNIEILDDEDMEIEYVKLIELSSNGILNDTYTDERHYLTVNLKDKDIYVRKINQLIKNQQMLVREINKLKKEGK